MSEPKFTCRLCRRRRPWSEGCDDEFPHLCDDCWFKVQPDDKIREEVNEAARTKRARQGAGR